LYNVNGKEFFMSKNFDDFKSQYLKNEDIEKIVDSFPQELKELNINNIGNDIVNISTTIFVEILEKYHHWLSDDI
jgi:hypothetical protein